MNKYEWANEQEQRVGLITLPRSGVIGTLTIYSILLPVTGCEKIWAVSILPSDSFLSI